MGSSFDCCSRAHAHLAGGLCLVFLCMYVYFVFLLIFRFVLYLFLSYTHIPSYTVTQPQISIRSALPLVPQNCLVRRFDVVSIVVIVSFLFVPYAPAPAPTSPSFFFSLLQVGVRPGHQKSTLKQSAFFRGVVYVFMLCFYWCG